MNTNETLSKIDVGIVHDWLPVLGGAEKVVQQFTEVFPDAELYTLFNFLSEDDEAFLNARTIHVSRLNKLPFVEKYYRNLLLMCTRHIEQFDVSKHELVLSSSAALAKGVLSGVDQPHVCYMHSPARYAWDLSHEYLKDIQGRLGWLKREIAKELTYRFRTWDARSTNTVDALIANSQFIQRRIYKVYRRRSKVIYPPVNIDKFSLYTGTREDYYVTASRLVPYKKIDLIVRAFTQKPEHKLVVIGNGPELNNLKKIAGDNIEFVGYQAQDAMVSLIQRAKAFVFAAFEDFGIVPVEAQACGTPVICYGKGGTSETVKPLSSDTPTGVWFMEQTPESIADAVDVFEDNIHRFADKQCRNNAEFFGNERFRNELSAFLVDGMTNGFNPRGAVLSWAKPSVNVPLVGNETSSR